MAERRVPSAENLASTSPGDPITRSADSSPSFHRRDCPLGSACVRVNRCRPNASAFVAQILRSMKDQANRFAAIDTGCRAIANHANGNLAHDVIRRLAPGGLEQAKNRYAVTGHVGSLSE